MYQFEKLDVWQGALDVIEVVYKLIDGFPNQEKFALVNQIQRSVTSIALNIAEGRGMSSDKEFKRFLRISLGSLFETVGAIKISVRLGYISEAEAETALALLDIQGAKIKALIKRLAEVKNGK